MEAAETLTKIRNRIRVDRMGISGGECTLNRPWLVRFIHELKVFNPDKDARFHVDTNGSLLTDDYIDELVDAGMTDIGIDLKAIKIDTFMRITGIKDRELATRYKDIAWEAVSYTVNRYSKQAFIGIGIPYNKDLISLKEIVNMGEEICGFDRSIQVTVLDYRPAFRSHILSPTCEEMEVIYEALKQVGLKTVLCQIGSGFIGP
jgi:pyruvate formate lyase activating enzyme